MKLRGFEMSSGVLVRIDRFLRDLRRSALPTWDRFGTGLVEPVRYAYGTFESRLMKRSTVSLLLLTYCDPSINEKQFDPLIRNRASTRRNVGIVTRRMMLGQDEADKRKLTTTLPKYDIVGLKLSSFLPTADVVRIVDFTKACMRDGAKLVFFDGDDDLGIAEPELLETYDLYVKRHCFKDRSRYLRGGIGKSNLTDFVARHYGFSFSDNPIPTHRPVPKGQLQKIVAGWSCGLDNKILRYARSSAAKADANKSIDVTCRAALGTRTSWRYYSRAPVQGVLESLGREGIAIAPMTTISQRGYRKEMSASRICVSPFGYGEICYRDFEAILSGCVLVKPDMSHVESYPGIFIAGVTYVPVKWDFSDLADVIRDLLADPVRCDHLRANAYSRLQKSMSEPAIEERIRAVFEPLLAELR